MPGLGKGLSSLIPDNSKRRITTTSVIDIPNLPTAGESIRQIALEKIKRNTYQPRQTFHHAHLEELAQSIKEHGILQPLIVTPLANGEYELIAGERRLRAAEILDMKTVPAIVRQASSQQKLELALIENIQRQELNLIEEAAAYQKLLDEFSLTHDDVAKRVGKSRSVVTNALRLLSLPETIRQAVMDGKISSSHARAIAALDDEQDQLSLFEKIITEKLNVRQVEQQAKKVVVQKHLRKVNIDPILDDMKESLRAVLGTKVEIKKKGERGSIIVNFYSEEELADLVKKISEL